jgi:mannose-6-phosphate isomerase
MTPRRIVGVEKNYDWGDEITIRHHLGAPSTPGTKVAELWFGTHPQGSSRVGPQLGTPLSDVTGEMTMLVKLIACAQPLSLQTHPTKEQAREGFAHEEAARIPRDAPHRMYRDESDKPEMIVAISKFEALCGFASIDHSVELLKSMGWTSEANTLSAEGIASYLAWSFGQDDIPSMSHAPEWLRRIAHLYPTDPALRIAPLLNHVVLEPGQALSLPAGNLHAYLHGFGLEVMNSSDNVIRAGFTTKHVDVNEFLRIVDTHQLSNPVVEVTMDGTYPSTSPGFTVGNSETINRHPDCHRVVYGELGDWDHSGFSIHHPEVVLVEAGTRAEFSSASLIVCTQH